MNKFTLWFFRIITSCFFINTIFTLLSLYFISGGFYIFWELFNEVQIPLYLIILIQLTPIVIFLLIFIFSKKIADYIFPPKVENSNIVMDETSIKRIIIIIGFFLILFSFVTSVDISYSIAKGNSYENTKNGASESEQITSTENITIKYSNLIGVVVGGLIIIKRNKIGRKINELT